MKNKWALLILVIAISLSCQTNNNQNNKDEAPTNTAISQEIFDPLKEGYKLYWEDQFQGTELDTTKWKVRGTGPRRIGYNDPSMVKVEDGNLLLMYDIKRDSIMGSAVGTYETFNTTYGYFECKAKLQKGIGPWAAFWMQSPLISDGEDPAKYGSEIDIFEYFKGAGKDHMTHCVHWAYGPNQKSCGQLNSDLEGLSEGFHTFALEWTPEKYAFYIDGLKFHEISVGLSHIDQYMILSMEIPATLEGIKNACAPDTFMVDYVKVYKKEK
ncbi:family 16 glycosylhydrolase [Sunxiuqinia elliptica]|uniref:Glycosyl hydrolase family 16 n=1 Tax=Sunxiuqinia elliptica TaxID=655355 RepID=A0A4V3BYU5_9BACT|nr:glycoside hydrolase family 16 protein [Sunxiuqinia elliptica]TDO04059.1 glycosyl hydrolase family 16 [Sunxiuqinia elliptica]TDO62341.1 glycosyl hydrolase family 16 [Sunxiuqinia elliptica]